MFAYGSLPFLPLLPRFILSPQSKAKKPRPRRTKEEEIKRVISRLWGMVSCRDIPKVSFAIGGGCLREMLLLSLPSIDFSCSLQEQTS